MHTLNENKIVFATLYVITKSKIGTSINSRVEAGGVTPPPTPLGVIVSDIVVITCLSGSVSQDAVVSCLITTQINCGSAGALIAADSRVHSVGDKQHALVPVALGTLKN